MGRLVTVKELASLHGITVQGQRKKMGGLEPDVPAQSRKPAMWDFDRYCHHAFLSQRGEALDLTAERARLAAAQADKQEMDNATRRGELAPVEWYEERLAAYTRAVASMLDALPLRIRQLLPHLSQIDHARIDRQLAEDRQRLADRLAGSEGEDGPGGGEGVPADANAATAAAE